MHRRLMLIMTILICMVNVFSVPLYTGAEETGVQAKQEELQARLEEIFEARAQAIITGAKPTTVLGHYDSTSLLGKYALVHEKTRLEYIQLWAAKRGVSFTEATPSLRIPWSQIEKDSAELVVHQSLKLGYIYPGDSHINHFGIGTRHWMKLARKDGEWLIIQDFYTDGIFDNTLSPDPVPGEGSAYVQGAELILQVKNGPTGAFDREGAVRYADKYAGLALSLGKDNNYNTRYKNMRDAGGDCTNYVSQCLADKEGGKLPMDGAWFYLRDRRGGEGSQAWVRAHTFADWIIYNGRGKRAARGNFCEVNNPTSEFPAGAIRDLQKGDVIGYGKRGGYVEHLAIVVGKDSKGYPLINSHSVDRFHCPWDIGYDKTTIFHLLKINDN